MPENEEFKGTPEARAIASLLDVVEELAMVVSTSEEWRKTVIDVFDEHRRELGVTRAQ